VKNIIVFLFVVAVGYNIAQAEWWVGAAILASSIIAGLIFLDAFLFKDEVYTTHEQPVTISSVMQLLPWVLYPFVDTDLTSFTPMFIGVVAGAANMLGFAFYYKAMGEDQDSVVTTIMFNLMIAVTPVMAFFWIGEELEVVQYVGIAIIFLGALIASWSKAKAKPQVIVLMVATVLLMSASTVLLKDTFEILEGEKNINAYWSGVLAYATGCGLVGLGFLVKIAKTKESAESFGKLICTYWPLFLTIEVSQVFADTLSAYALNAGKASIITSLDGVMGIVTTALSIMLVYVLLGTKAGFGKVRTAVELRNEHLENFGAKCVGMFLVVIGAYLTV
jgi:drug/metabolite transporter (DMT)-like permease